MQKEVDFLVIGSGIAGLSYAIKAAEHGKVLILTKASERNESNTKYAQGGIAAVMLEKDSYESHIADTLDAGAGINDKEVVRMVIEQSTARINELIAWGANFDKNKDGEYDLVKEGGHSEKRILHHKDNTGYEIERAMLEQVHNHKNIELVDHIFAIDILTQHHIGEVVHSHSTDIKCFGAYVLNTKTNQIETVLAKVTLMASGGAGQVYATTTNPKIATGDGIAMAYRARGFVRDMEFMQFHPTALYNPGEHPSFLITEAVRGHGGILKTKSGAEFMQKYDKRLSLAPRDIVARAIDNEMKSSGDEHVYLDCTHMEKEDFILHFPNIYEKCMGLGIDPMADMIPVLPAAHYLCGGIKVDMDGQSSIENLYAVGECACTGLHGGNRLASNSLLEALVYGHNAAKHSIEKSKTIGYQKNIPNWNAEGTEQAEEMILITQNLKEVQQIMSNYVGIVRSPLRLLRALNRLEIIYLENEKLYEKTIITTQLCELRNLITVAYLIIKQAMRRKTSIGLHYMAGSHS
jgi:L-aspartate oxidase